VSLDLLGSLCLPLALPRSESNLHPPGAQRRFYQRGATSPARGAVHVYRGLLSSTCTSNPPQFSCPSTRPSKTYSIVSSLVRSLIRSLIAVSLKLSSLGTISSVERTSGGELALTGGSLGTVQLEVNGRILLIPTPSRDPNDPLNWSRAFKIYITVLACAAVFLSNYLAVRLAPPFLETYRG
jgi:hypothetical protein